MKYLRNLSFESRSILGAELLDLRFAPLDGSITALNGEQK